MLYDKSSNQQRFTPKKNWWGLQQPFLRRSWNPRLASANQALCCSSVSNDILLFYCAVHHITNAIRRHRCEQVKRSERSSVTSTLDKAYYSWEPTNTQSGIAYILSVNDPEVEITLKDEVMEVSCTGGHTPASSTDAHAQSANALHQDMPSAFQDIPSAFPV